jgi:predicted enzyme related to lactoylglutathione lyase
MLSTDFVAGAPNWIDLGSPAVEASTAFYTNLLGWQYQSAGPDSGGYGFFSHDGKTVAAVGPLTEQGAKPSWTVYFNTPDANDTTKAVEAAGGTVRMAPTDVFNEGRMAAYTDPTGAQFAVWQPGDTKGLGMVTSANSLAWTELYTTDAAAAKSFYADVFGWTTEDSDMGGGMIYTVVKPATGGETSSQGGIMQLNPEMTAAGQTSRWGVYFEVADCDASVAKAVELGGRVIMGPESLEGVGRMAALLDPHGVAFSVIASAMPAQE